MPLVYLCKLCVLACLVLKSIAMEKTQSSIEVPNQITTISEGTDCRCRCILKTEEGKPCENNPNRKRNVFLVDTISAGRDCRCSCLASIPPDNCKLPEPESSETRTESKKKSAQNYVIKIPVTISGTSDDSEILNALANRTNIREQILTKFNVVKMQMKLLKLALALEELDQEINSSFINNPDLAPRNLLEVAKLLIEKNETKDGIGEGTIDKKPLMLAEKRTETQEDPINNISTNQQHDDEGESATSTNNRTVDIPHAVSSEDVSSSESIEDLTLKNFTIQQEMTTNLPNVDTITATSRATNAKLTSKNEETMITLLHNETTSQAIVVDEPRESLHSRTKQTVFAESSATGNADNVNETLSVQTKNKQTMEKNEELVTSTTAEKATEYLRDQVAMPRITNRTANETQKAQPSPSEQIGQDTQSNATAKDTELQTASTKAGRIEDSTKSGNTSNESAVSDPRKHIRKTSNSSPTTQTASHTVDAVHGRTPPKGSRGKIELYRNSKPKQVKVKQSKSSIASAYYEDYYDYSNTDEALVVHPPLISSKVEPSGDAVDVAVTTTTSTDTTRAEENYMDNGFVQATQYSSMDTTAEENYNFATYDTNEYYDSYGDHHKTSAESATTRHTATTTKETASPTEKTTAASQDECGTLLNLSKPRDVHDFGRKEGAWMTDAAASPKNQNKIFVTNFYYGNNLIEFESISNFKNFRWSNSYMLPYNWIGTGHIVYNGSFYYNRAFSRNLIKFDLKYRFVSAWGHLRNAVYDSSTPFTWRGHTMVHMAADKTGLWVIYPAYSDFQIYQNSDSYVINKINPHDLSTMSSWRTSLQRNSVSHFFVVCGVVYATDRYNQPKARITYAYDTHTRVRRALYLPFSNKYSHNVQLLYDFNERKLLSWDNGHQVAYDITLTY